MTLDRLPILPAWALDAPCEGLTPGERHGYHLIKRTAASTTSSADGVKSPSACLELNSYRPPPHSGRRKKPHSYIRRRPWPINRKETQACCRQTKLMGVRIRHQFVYPSVAPYKLSGSSTLSVTPQRHLAIRA